MKNSISYNLIANLYVRQTFYMNVSRKRTELQAKQVKFMKY